MNLNIIRSINFLKIPDIYMYIRQKITNSYIIILAYHRVYPKKDNLFVPYISPEEFENQIKYLQKYFKIFSLEKLVNFLKNNKIYNEDYKNIAVITFDDGYKDNYIYAFPILKNNRIPATIFLATNYIGKDELFWWDKVGYIIYNTKKDKINIPNIGEYLFHNDKEKRNCVFILLEKLKKFSNKLKNKYILMLQNICNVTIPYGLGRKMVLSWDEVHEMNDNGIYFGAHTKTHAILTNENLKETEKEIVDSKKTIEDHLKIKITSFSYPNGSLNNEIVNLIKNNGFDCAVSTNESLINKYSINDLYNLPRIGAPSSFSRFKIRTSGIFSDFNSFCRK